MFDAIDKLAAAPSAQEIAHVLAAAAAKCDVAYASHRVLHVDGTAHGVTTMPQAWVDHYFASGYDKLDPGKGRASLLRGTGGDSFETPKPGEIWTKAMTQMNGDIRQLHATGSFFVTHSTTQPGVTSMVNFITDAPGAGYERWVEASAPKLRLLAAAAHARMMQLSGTLPTEVTLTGRERDVLQWLAEGHRVDRIAERMGISNRTVEVHLASARRRVGAKTREQALAIAINSGLLNDRT
ncbi:MAG: LuxR C-terminal-related transcriptional regulator [Pseudomonadota bacterium]